MMSPRLLAGLTWGELELTLGHWLHVWSLIGAEYGRLPLPGIQQCEELPKRTQIQCLVHISEVW